MNPSLKILGLALLLATAACKKNEPAPGAGTPAPPPAASAPAPMPAEPAPAPASEPVAAPKLQAAMRGLWHDHIVHSREYALAMRDGSLAEG